MSDDIYTEEEKEKRLHNVEEVPDLLKKGDKGLLNKINRAVKRFNLTKEYIVQEIRKRHKITLIYFAKDPRRQKFHENKAIEYIRKIEGVTGISTPKPDLYPHKGKLIPRPKGIPASSFKTKSIDFEIDYMVIKIYASHKYTEESGGAQDNQRDDVGVFIEEAKKVRLPGVFFIAIVDGDYYKIKNTQTGKTRLEELKMNENDRVKVCDIYSLESVMRNLNDS